MVHSIGSGRLRNVVRAAPAHADVARSEDELGVVGAAWLSLRIMTACWPYVYRPAGNHCRVINMAVYRCVNKNPRDPVGGPV